MTTFWPGKLRFTPISIRRDIEMAHGANGAARDGAWQFRRRRAGRSCSGGCGCERGCHRHRTPLEVTSAIGCRLGPGWCPGVQDREGMFILSFPADIKTRPPPSCPPQRPGAVTGSRRASPAEIGNGLPTLPPSRAYGTQERYLLELPASHSRATTPLQTPRDRRSQTHTAQNILCLPQRDTASTEKVATLKRKWRKTYCVYTEKVATRKRRWRKTYCTCSAPTPRKHQQRRHSQTQMAQNILCLTPRPPANNEMLDTRKCKWRKTCCVWHNDTPGTVKVVSSAQNFEDVDAPCASATVRRHHCKCRHFRVEFQGRSTRQRDFCETRRLPPALPPCFKTCSLRGDDHQSITGTSSITLMHHSIQKDTSTERPFVTLSGINRGNRSQTFQAHSASGLSG